MELGKTEDAQAQFRASLTLQPDRASADTKLARATLEIDRQRLEMETARRLLENPELAREMHGKPSVAVMLSAIFPGLGQLYKGQYPKAAAMAGFQILCLAYIGLAHDQSRALLYKVFGRPDTGDVGPLIVWILFMATFMYLYSLIDASIEKKPATGLQT